MDAVRIDSSARLMAERDALLERSGILREEQADAVFGIVDGEGKLVACGNCRGCSLRCIAVDESCRGEDMLSTLVSAMLEYQFMRGISHVFICTKAKNAPVFAGIGFYEVARAGDAAVLMENRRGGFGGYIASLERGSDELETIPGVVPNLLHLPAGCSFSPRCAKCGARCADAVPELREVSPGHLVRCINIPEVRP